MVETRTKRFLEQQDEEPCDNVSVDTLAGSEHDDLPHDSAGHVVLYKTRQPPKQFMDLVGGAIKFEQLMLCEILFDSRRDTFRRSQHQLHRSLTRRHIRACHRGLIFKMDRAVPLQGQYGGVSMPLSSRTLRLFRFTQPYTIRSRTTLR